MLEISSCALGMIHYLLGDYLFFEKKEKRCWIYGIGLLFYLVLVFWRKGNQEELQIWMMLVVLASYYFSMKGDRKSKFLQTCTLFFLMTSFYGVVQFLYNLFGSQQFLTELGAECYLIRDLIGMFILGAAVLAKKRIPLCMKQHFSKAIEDYVNYIIVFTAWMITAAISLLGFVSQYIHHSFFQRVSFFMGGAAYLCVGLLGSTMIYLTLLNKKMKILMHNEVMMKDMQKKYYEALLKREEETRAYRHDMSNHLLCLDYLLHHGELEKAQDYLKDLQQEIAKIKGKKYKTGNEVLDVITNYYLPELSDQIQVHFQMLGNLQLEGMKICTIYANLLQNAVEELKSDLNRPGELRIMLRQDGQKCKLMIRNSIFREQGERLLETQKEDKKNHGIGLSNVRKTVEDMGGRMLISVEEKLFKVYVEWDMEMTVDGVKEPLAEL